MMLEAKKLTCSRGYRDLFKDLSFDLESGQLMLVEGENGSGKSTLLKIVSGLRQPDNGRMYWNGDEIEFASTNYAQQIVWLSHRNGVNASLTAKENIQVTANLSKSTLADINLILERVGLKPYANTLARKFSAGMKRRLALSRLLVNKSKLWILDEPQSALDKTGIALLEELIEQHVTNDGMVIMSSHHDVFIKNVAIKKLVI